jgi:hypothetical protein
MLPILPGTQCCADKNKRCRERNEPDWANVKADLHTADLHTVAVKLKSICH